MKVLSLFSGVGGFDMGLENAGMETVFQCEWDKHCRTILDRHWPTVPKWNDVSTLTGEYILAHAPVIDVVAWGSPCQDLSVAGKRAGLEGGRSGLFYEGMRIINELRKASNGKYPRISIWENVYGALNSNKGEDFEAILKEMVEAGSLLCEWRVLDAQYFGVPQRRRRVFVVAVFDSATANRCPDPLLPVSEGLLWNPTTRTTKRQESADTTSASIGSGSQWWDGGQIANALTTTSNEQRMPDKDRLQAVVIEPFTPSSFAQYEQGVGTLRSNGGDLGGGSETLVVNQDRTYRDITGALLGRDSFGPNHEGARDGKLILEPMLIDGRRVDDVRIYEEPVQTLQARMGTGGNNVPMLMFDTQFGSNANVFENQSPTLKASQAAPSVAYGITGNAIGRQDHNGPNGPSHTPEGGPMFTLTGTDIHAVAYDEYNDTLGGDIHHALRAGTKQSTGVVVGTLRSGGDGGVPSSRGEHLVVEPNVAIPIDTRNALRNPDKYDAQNRQGLGIGADGDPMATLTSAHVNAVAAGFKAGQGAQSRSIGYQEGMAQTLTSDMNGLEPTVLTPTMVVRRLTPLECERLMGWPDDHTRYKADGTEQADTHRYKQCGNGVASPVAQWIGEQLIGL